MPHCPRAACRSAYTLRPLDCLAVRAPPLLFSCRASCGTPQPPSWRPQAQRGWRQPEAASVLRRPKAPALRCRHCAPAGAPGRRRTRACPVLGAERRMRAQSHAEEEAACAPRGWLGGSRARAATGRCMAAACHGCMALGLKFFRNTKSSEGPRGWGRLRAEARAGDGTTGKTQVRRAVPGRSRVGLHPRGWRERGGRKDNASPNVKREREKRLWARLSSLLS